MTHTSETVRTSPPTIYTVAWTDGDGKAQHYTCTRLHVALGFESLKRRAGFADARLLTQAEAKRAKKKGLHECI